MIQKILPATLIANLFFIISINEKYLAINGLWIHLIAAALLVIMAFYATTSTARQRLVLLFFTLFTVINLGYFWLNESIYSINRLTFYQSPSLFFETPPSYLKAAWVQLAQHRLSIFGYFIIIANLICLFIKPPPARFSAPKLFSILGKAEIPLVALSVFALLAFFPAVTHAIKNLNQYKNVQPIAEDSNYAQIIQKLSAVTPKTEKFRPSKLRSKEKIGYFDVFKLDDRVVYYSTNCDQIDLSIRFFVQYWPENLRDIPKARRQHKFDNIRFTFAEHGIKHSNLCYTEQPLPAYKIKRYRTGQHSKETGNTWAADFYK